MSYGLRTRRGLYGLGVIDGRRIGVRGLGAVPYPTFEVCAGPWDSPCVARNEVTSDNYNVAVAQALAQSNMDQCEANARLSPDQYQPALLARCQGQLAIQSAPDNPVVTTWDGSHAYAPAAPPMVITPRGGQFSFQSSRGGTSLYVGDTWTVSITGATPNSPVTVVGTANTGPFGTTTMGTTDSAGNFSKSGTLGTGDVGNWGEQWSVGGLPSGTVSFSVQPISVAAPSGGATPLPTSGTTPPVLTPVVTAPAGTTAGFDFSTIPWWGWAAGAGVALFAFGGKR
jgi:hypothetical protein